VIFFLLNKHLSLFAPQNEKSIFYNHLTKIKEMNKCPIIGLTGTLMQNNHEELFNLVDLVEPGLLGPWSIFQKEVAAPIKYGR
jgi:SNF2 family DNA or RNA helicase